MIPYSRKFSKEKTFVKTTSMKITFADLCTCMRCLWKKLSQMGPDPLKSQVFSLKNFPLYGIFIYRIPQYYMANSTDRANRIYQALFSSKGPGNIGYHVCHKILLQSAGDYIYLFRLGKLFPHHWVYQFLYQVSVDNSCNITGGTHTTTSNMKICIAHEPLTMHTMLAKCTP